MHQIRIIDYKYEFHNDGCADADKNPKANPKDFYFRGTNSASSKKFQCKTCMKITSIKAPVTKNFNFNQKKNALLLDILKDIIGKSPVKRACETFEISPKTYYHKLDMIYTKCVEFAQRHEGKIKEINQNTAILVSDALVFSYNKQRTIGKRGIRKTFVKRGPSESVLSIFASSDHYSNYIYRADLSYDTKASIDEIEEDTKMYKCDHSEHYLRKNSRLVFDHYPMMPSRNDTQSQAEYTALVNDIDDRKLFVAGLETAPNYTRLAHLYMVKEMISANKFIHVTDDEKAHKSAIFKVYKDEFKSERAEYFTIRTEDSLSLEKAKKAAYEQRRDTKKWGIKHGIEKDEVTRLAREKIYEMLGTHNLYNHKPYNGVWLKVPNNNPIIHPMPYSDEGYRYVDLINPTSMNDWLIAHYMSIITKRPLDSFFQRLRRKFYIFERPMVNARAVGGKSYQYAPQNPAYTEKILEIARIVHNYVWTMKYYDTKSMMTPAQRMGIVDKQFALEDIIYFR